MKAMRDALNNGLPDGYDTPGEVQIVEGFVVQLGPDSVQVSMTPDAAEETGRRLIQAAEEARAPDRPRPHIRAAK